MKCISIIALAIFMAVTAGCLDFNVRNESGTGGAATTQQPVQPEQTEEK